MLGDAEPLRGFASLEGNEKLVAEELGTLLPRATISASFAGLLVARDPDLDPELAMAAPVHPAFARAEFTVWGEARSEPARAARRLASEIELALEEGGTPPALHVWAQGIGSRDERTRDAKALEKHLRHALGGRVRSKIAADPGDDVIDVACVEPGTYIFGAHRRTPLMSAFPGGMRRLAARPDAPSRAHLKLEEALEWAPLPFRPGDVAVDVGCAPGGWSLILLERGLEVHGVDPTPLAPSILKSPRFFHHRSPVRKFDPSGIAKVRWVFCDMNGPPFAALGQLGRLLPRCRGVEAVLHTIKLSDDPPLAVLAEARAFFRAAGFDDVRVRHLYHNREELTLLAVRRPTRAGRGPAGSAY